MAATAPRSSKRCSRTMGITRRLTATKANMTKHRPGARRRGEGNRRSYSSGQASLVPRPVCSWPGMLPTEYQTYIGVSRPAEGRRTTNAAGSRRSSSSPRARRRRSFVLYKGEGDGSEVELPTSNYQLPRENRVQGNGALLEAWWKLRVGVYWANG